MWTKAEVLFHNFRSLKGGEYTAALDNLNLNGHFTHILTFSALRPSARPILDATD